MPELPEVETIKLSLSSLITNKKIKNVKILLSRLIKYPNVDEFIHRITNTKIKKINRTGKYLRFQLSNGVELIVHLRMTGQLIYQKKSVESIENKHIHIKFSFDDGTTLFYLDVRTFGALYAVYEPEIIFIKGLNLLGPEPLTKEFSVSYLRKLLQGKKTNIKNFLLNQKNISGLGNIYADEALFLAKLHPTRTSASLSKEETIRLHAAINKVINDGIIDGGTTFRDYRDGLGKKGRHQNKLYVYQRAQEKCRFCEGIIEKINLSGRSSHFCPICQKG